MEGTLNPPSARLPHIKSLPSCSPDVFQDCLRYIREIYHPEIRGSRIKLRNHAFPLAPSCPYTRLPSFYKAQPRDSSSADDLKSDQFERAYVIRWLTAFIAHQLEAPVINDSSSCEDLTQDASSLLAICSGTAGAGKISRSFKFSPSTDDPSTPKEPIVVHLNDIPLDNHDYSSVGAQTWGGACVLAELIVEAPEAFGLAPAPESASESGLRVLELGAGTGLVGLVVAKMIQGQSRFSKREPLVLATDFYPSVLKNLAANGQLNFPPHATQPVRFSSHFLDWSQHAALESLDPPFDNPFDVVFGADIIYEADHAEWIKNCLKHLLRKPTSENPQTHPTFHLIIPLRPTHHFESSTIENVFHLRSSELDSTHLKSPELQIVSKEVIVCSADISGGGDEVRYVYYRIQWCGT